MENDFKEGHECGLFSSKVELSNLSAVVSWPGIIATPNKIRKMYLVYERFLADACPVEQILSTRSADNDGHDSFTYFIGLL